MSLATRLILTLVVPIALCFGAFGYVTVRLRREAIMVEADQEVRDHGTALQVALDAFLRDHHVAEMSELAENLERADRILGVLVYDRADRAVSSSRSVARHGDALAHLARQVLAGGRPRAEVRALAGATVYVYAFPIGPRANAAPRGTAVLLRDLRYVDAFVASFARQLALGCVLVMAVVALGVWLAMRAAVLRPITALLGSVERVAAGDLAAEIAVARRDEMGRLARAFNRMLASLRTARDEIEAQSEANVALERRLQHAQRLALIGQLSASVAHQIGSPLNVILGRARYALEQGVQSERDKRHFEQIAGGAETISKVIERLLSQARRVRGRVGPVDLGLLAKDTVRFLEAECEHAGVVATVEAERGVCVEGTRDELEQVILNLCVNAIQAQPRGGRLQIVVRRARDSDGQETAEVLVSDAGPGIPAELREKVFEAFYTTKPASEGTGLGLAICDEIVRREGGTIVALESPGGGALFRISLPGHPGPNTRNRVETTTP